MSAYNLELNPGEPGYRTAGPLVKQALWWICLLVAPAILLGIELFHPANFTAHPGMYQFLSHAEHDQPQFKALAYFGPIWWFTLHMIQTPMVGLVAVGLWLLINEADDRSGALAAGCAWIARVATFVFLIYYTALDAIGGIGLGRTILTAQTMAADGRLSPTQFDGVVLLLNNIWTDPWVGGVGSFISEAGSWAILTAAFFTAVTLALSRQAGRFAILPLLGFGWELQVSHASPHGPIAFALLIVAAGWIRWSRRTGSSPKT
jgi:hypothetical protein